MLKKIGFVVATTVTGLAMLGGVASADPTAASGDEPSEGFDQVGLITLNNTNLLDEVLVPVGACKLLNLINIEDILNGANIIPFLNPGDNASQGEPDDNCAQGAISDGGDSQGN